MKKIVLGVLVLSILGCGKVTYDDVKEKVGSFKTTSEKIEYLEKFEEKTSEEDLSKIKNLQMELERKLEKEKEIARKEEAKAKIKAMLPPRDGFNKGVAFSVVNFFKENFNDYDNIQFLGGGNTLRLSNGVFFQDVRIKYFGSATTMYFLIKDNSYDSSSILATFNSSKEFYDGYLKANNLQIAEDEVYDYYFNK